MKHQQQLIYEPNCVFVQKLLQAQTSMHLTVTLFAIFIERSTCSLWALKEKSTRLLATHFPGQLSSVATSLTSDKCSVPAAPVHHFRKTKEAVALPPVSTH